MDCTVYHKNELLKGSRSVVRIVAGTVSGPLTAFPANKSGMRAALKQVHGRMVTNGKITQPLKRILGKSEDVPQARRVIAHYASSIEQADVDVPRINGQIDQRSFKELLLDATSSAFNFNQNFRYAKARLLGGNHNEAMIYALAAA